MTQIHSYLTFTGNCLEAMTFYADCIGGTLEVQKIGETALAEKMPAQMKECILHARLTKDTMVLMGTDMVPDKGIVKGNAISLMLTSNNEAEIKNYFDKLSAGGEVIQPLEDTFSGSTMGDLTDKYGNHWLLNFNKATPSKYL